MKTKLFLAYIFEFLRDGYYLAIFLLMPFLVKDIHLTLFQTGSLQTVVNILIMILAIPIVYLLVEFGEIRLLLLSISLYALGFFGFYLSHSYFALLFVFGLMGCSFAIYATVSSHMRTTWFTKETRGKELGNLMAVGDVAKVIFSLLVGTCAGLIGWRFTSMYIGIVTGFIFLFCGFLFTKIRKLDIHTDHSIKHELTHNSYSYFLKQKKFMSALIAGSLDEGINAPFYAFLPFLLLTKGVSIMFIGEFASIYYIGNIISRLVFGRLVDTVGHAKIFILLELSMFLLTFLIAIVNILYIVAFLALLLGFITEGTDPATASMLADSLEQIEKPQKAAGMRAVANGISKAIFPFILGFIATKFGIVVGFYSLAFACLLPIIPAFTFLRQNKVKVFQAPLLEVAQE